LIVPTVSVRAVAVEIAEAAVPRAVVGILYRTLRVVEHSRLAAGVGVRVAPVAVCRTLHQAVVAARVVALALVGASIDTHRFGRFTVFKAARRERPIVGGRGEKKDQTGAERREHQQSPV
jgi:hypothetical protein